MKAVVITQPGPPDVLKIEERETPQPREGEVLIKVNAAGVNRPDIFQRKGNYPPPPGVAADIPGLEVAGTVAKCGGEVSRWQEGDRVCALLTGAGYAEYAVADARHCLPVPTGMSFSEAASLPETVFTVWHNVFERAGLREGEHLLVHGGSSGIGITAIQLAKARGARVSITAGSQDKCEACARLGADTTVLYRQDDFEQILKEPNPLSTVLPEAVYSRSSLNVCLNRKSPLLFLISAEFSSTGIRAIFIGKFFKPRKKSPGSSITSVPPSGTTSKMREDLLKTPHAS